MSDCTCRGYFYNNIPTGQANYTQDHPDFMDEVEEVKKRINIVDVVGTYVPLKKAGRNFRANCPFHSEKSPSFIVSADRQIWHCFGSCHEGGDVITFLMKWENISFAEALEELARQAGVTLQKRSGRDDATHKRERMFSMNMLAAKYFHYVLMQTPQGTRAKEYLYGVRAVREAIAQTYQIGFAPDSWDSLKVFLMKKGYSESELETVGLISRGTSGRTFDRFRARLIFPILDTRANVIGFSGRLIEGITPGRETAKYVNTQETPIYHKRESLFGIYQAKDAIKKAGFALLVEGEFDAILPYQEGISNTVAVKGSAITQEQLQLIRRYANKIVFAMDADASGIDAVKRGLTEAEALEMEVAVVQLEDAKDPDEAVRSHAQSFKKAIQNPTPVYDFLFDQLQQQHQAEGAYGKKSVIDGVVTHLNHIKNPIVQSHYIKLFSRRLDVDEDSIKRAMKLAYGAYRKRPVSRQTSTKKSYSRIEVVARTLLSMMIQKRMNGDMLQLVFDNVQPKWFDEGAYRKLFVYLKENRGSLIPESDVDPARGLMPELTDLYNELYLLGSYDEGVLHEHQTRMVYEFKLLWLKGELASLGKQLMSADDDTQLAEEYALRKQELAEVEKMVSSL